VADAGRVIAGSAKGVRLAAPGPGTRPLTDRVKQTLFGILEPDLDGAVVLDLFAGSGAGGIEALSRGAARAVFVERDRRAAATIEENLRRAGFGRPEAEVLRASVETVLGAFDRAPGGALFDLVLADPPYDQPAALADTLSLLGEPGAPLAAGAMVVAKHFWRDAPPATVGLLASEREKRFGETALTFYRRRADRAPVTGSEEAIEG
jgi:16S rRNA (guanine966-N2)-methyltransferase